MKKLILISAAFPLISFCGIQATREYCDRNRGFAVIDSVAAMSNEIRNVTSEAVYPIVTNVVEEMTPTIVEKISSSVVGQAITNLTPPIVTNIATPIVRDIVWEVSSNAVPELATNVSIETSTIVSGLVSSNVTESLVPTSVVKYMKENGVPTHITNTITTTENIFYTSYTNLSMNVEGAAILYSGVSVGNWVAFYKTTCESRYPGVTFYFTMSRTNVVSDSTYDEYISQDEYASSGSFKMFIKFRRKKDDASYEPKRTDIYFHYGSSSSGTWYQGGSYVTWESVDYPLALTNFDYSTASFSGTRIMSIISSQMYSYDSYIKDYKKYDSSDVLIDTMAFMSDVPDLSSLNSRMSSAESSIASINSTISSGVKTPNYLSIYNDDDKLVDWNGSSLMRIRNTDGLYTQKKLIGTLYYYLFGIDDTIARSDTLESATNALHESVMSAMETEKTKTYSEITNVYNFAKAISNNIDNISITRLYGTNKTSFVTGDLLVYDTNGIPYDVLAKTSDVNNASVILSDEISDASNYATNPSRVFDYSQTNKHALAVYDLTVYSYYGLNPRHIGEAVVSTYNTETNTSDYTLYKIVIDFEYKNYIRIKFDKNVMAFFAVHTNAVSEYGYGDYKYYGKGSSISDAYFFPDCISNHVNITGLSSKEYSYLFVFNKVYSPKADYYQATFGDFGVREYNPETNCWNKVDSLISREMIPDCMIFSDCIISNDGRIGSMPVIEYANNEMTINNNAIVPYEISEQSPGGYIHLTGSNQLYKTNIVCSTPYNNSPVYIYRNTYYTNGYITSYYNGMPMCLNGISMQYGVVYSNDTEKTSGWVIQRDSYVDGLGHRYYTFIAYINGESEEYIDSYNMSHYMPISMYPWRQSYYPFVPDLKSQKILTLTPSGYITITDSRVKLKMATIRSLIK